MYIYIYIYICACVCVCVYKELRRQLTSLIYLEGILQINITAVIAAKPLFFKG